MSAERLLLLALLLLCAGALAISLGLYWRSALRMRRIPCDQPWLRRADWASGMVRANTLRRPVLAGLFGSACLAACAATALLGFPLLLSVALLLAGVVFGVRALRAAVLHARFGAAELRLKSLPVRLGSTLEAQLRAPARLFEGTPKLAQLQCCERCAPSGDSDLCGCLVWSSEPVSLLPGVGRSDPDDGASAGTRTDAKAVGACSIAIPVPAELPPATPPPGHRVSWHLFIMADDYERKPIIDFEVPVFESGSRELAS